MLKVAGWGFDSAVGWVRNRSKLTSAQSNSRRAAAVRPLVTRPSVSRFLRTDTIPPKLTLAARRGTSAHGNIGPWGLLGWKPTRTAGPPSHGGSTGIVVIGIIGRVTAIWRASLRRGHDGRRRLVTHWLLYAPEFTESPRELSTAGVGACEDGVPRIASIAHRRDAGATAWFMARRISNPAAGFTMIAVAS